MTRVLLALVVLALPMSAAEAHYSYRSFYPPQVPIHDFPATDAATSGSTRAGALPEGRSGYVPAALTTSDSQKR